MNYINLDLSGSEFHNVLLNPANQREVREEELTLFTPSAGDECWGGFTVNKPTTGTVLQYIFTVTTATRALTGRIYDEFFNLVGTFSAGTVTDSSAPLTYSVVYNQIVVNSPGLSSPLWGFIGSGLIPAVSQPSINTDTPALSLFPGIVCTFGDRCVWAYANQAIISDPGTEPRTITSPNALSFEGQVIDMVVNGDGNLVIVTTAATYTLPVDGLAGIAYTAQITKNTSWSGLKTRNTGVLRGSVVGMSRQGLVQLNSNTPIVLTKYTSPRFLTRPVGPGQGQDWRSATLFSGDGFVAVNINGKICLVDSDAGGITWLYGEEDTYSLVGTGKMSDGRTMWITKNSVFVFYGKGAPVVNDITHAGACTTWELEGYYSPLIRELNGTTDTGGINISTYCRNSIQTSLVPTIPGGVLVGTTTWSSQNFRGNEWRSRRHQRAVRVDTGHCEISITIPGAQLQQVLTVLMKGQGTRRPSR